MRALSMLLFSVGLAGCVDSGCVSAANAKEWTRLARQYEADGRIHEAWQYYKSIGIAESCESDPSQRAIASSHRKRLFTEINLAYEATAKAIEAYRTKNGHLPRTLVDIEGDIPESARRAFAGFHYTANAEARDYVLKGRAD